MEFGEVGIWLVIILLFVGGILGAIYGISWIMCNSQAGQKYDVTVTVQAVERSTRFGDHTNLWVKVYGEQDITYKLIGFHDFEIDKTYRIIFVDEMWLCNFGVWWFEIRGKVQSVELLSP